MGRPKVFVARKLTDGPLRLLDQSCEVDLWPHFDPPSHEELLSRAVGKDAILTLLTDKIDAHLLDHAGPDLKIVSNHAVGVDNIDLNAATERGVLVGHTPGVLTDATADLALGLMLAVGRRLVESVEYIRAGKWTTWHPTMLLGMELRGATLGIVGMGAIGKAVATRAAAFGMDVRYFSRSAQPDVAATREPTLAALLKSADVVSLHVPLTDQTHHIIDRQALSQMKTTALLINTARGGVVDTSALVEALRDAVIGGAGLDVTDPEPLPADHPLMSLPSCVVVPHIGSATSTTREKMGMMAAKNLLAALRGQEPPHLANPEALVHSPRFLAGANLG